MDSWVIVADKTIDNHVLIGFISLKCFRYGGVMYMFLICDSVIC